MARKRTERLLRELACKLGEAANEWQHKFEEMRTERDALAARVKRLRAALRFYSAAEGHWMVGDCRIDDGCAADAALKEDEDGR